MALITEVMYALSTGYFPQLHHDYDPRPTRSSDVPAVLPDGDVYIDVFLKGRQDEII